MEHKHLSDDEIQALLDTHHSIDEIRQKHHLENCQICLDAIKQYHDLYEALEKEPGFGLSKHFAKSLVAKITHKQSVPFISSTLEIALIITGILLALGVTFYFVSLKSFTQTMGRIALPNLTINTSLIQPIKDLVAGLNGSLILVPFAGLVLLVVAVLDRIIQKLKHHKLSL